MKPLAVFALLLSLSSILCAETLHDILQRNGIPESSFSKTELAQDGTGLAQDFSGTVVVAFAPQTEVHVLRVIRFERASKKLVKTDLTDREIDTPCVHSVFDISKFAGRFFLVADINPSASCTLMLNDADLAVQSIFYGWPDADVGESGMVFEEDQVHFQPVHSLRLRYVDLKLQSAPEIYPPDHDPLREQFSAELRKNAPTRAWCETNNNPCDPMRFEEDMGMMQADPSGNGFAFIVTRTADGFGDNAIAKVADSPAFYVYRKDFKGWAYCERELHAGEQPLPAPLASDYAASTHTCTHFQPVGVRPVESPFSKFEIKPASAGTSKH